MNYQKIGLVSIIAIVAFPLSVLGQCANYLSVFGNAGCSDNNRITCAVTPSSSSFTGIPIQADPYSSISPAPRLA